MKNIFLLLVILLSNYSFAQHGKENMYSGIFMTFQDYEANKLSYPGNCDSTSNKIQADCLWSQRYVYVLRRGKKIKFSKDSVFGYRNCKLNDFRFNKRDDREYRILETKGMIIYTSEVRKYSSTGKTFTMIPAYFFSKTLSSEILPLSIMNLKRAFPNNIKFHDSLDVEFYGVKDISAYDISNKMYKVNFLLNQSLNL